MNDNEIIDKLSIELKDIQFFIDNIGRSENISGVDIDIIMNKLRNLYEYVFKLKYPAFISKDIKDVPETKPVKEKVKREVKKTREEPVGEKETPLIAPENPEDNIAGIQIPSEIAETEAQPVPVPVIEPAVMDEEKEEVNVNENPEENIVQNENENTEENTVQTVNLNVQEDVIDDVNKNVIKDEEKDPAQKQIINEVKPGEESLVADEGKLIEINGDFSENVVKKPEIKQTSLFGDDNELNQDQAKIKPPEKKESISEKLLKSQLSVNDVLSNNIKETNIASQLQHNPITNIRSVISINDRIWFVKELFDNNNDKYNRVVDKINGFSTYNEAVDYLSSIFNIGQEKESLTKFFEIVQRRFLIK